MKVRVGVVGLGVMGAAIARNVLKAGYPLSVYDINDEVVAELVDEGAQACESCAHLASQSDRILVIVPDSEHVRQVVLGDKGVLEGAASGSIILQMSTIAPETVRDVAQQAAAHGVRLLDVPLCRSSRHAVEGRLMLLLGGEQQDVDDCMPLLRVLGDTFHHTGPVGSAITMKLINNSMLQGMGLAILECITLGVKAGLELEQMVEILSGTAASNRLMEVGYVRSAFRGDYSLGFPLDWAFKDVGHTIDLARSLQSPAFSLALVHQLQNIARNQGKGRMDHSAMLTVIEELAGVQVKGEIEIKEF